MFWVFNYKQKCLNTIRVAWGWEGVSDTGRQSCAKRGGMRKRGLSKGLELVQPGRHGEGLCMWGGMGEGVCMSGGGRRALGMVRSRMPSRVVEAGQVESRGSQGTTLLCGERSCWRI